MIELKKISLSIKSKNSIKSGGGKAAFIHPEERK
jgi:hypothetical protein